MGKPVVYTWPAASTTAVAALQNTFNVANTITIGAGVRALAITADGQFAYVVSNSSTTVSVIGNASSVYAAVIATITIPLTTFPTVSINPVGGNVYIGEGNSDDVVVISGTTVIATINVGQTTGGIITFSPDGTKAYCTGNTVSVAVIQNASSNNPTFLVNLPTLNTQNVVFTSDGKYAYAANESATTISLIQNASSNNPTILQTITGFNQPYQVAITPNSQRVFVPNQATAANSVSVITGADSGSPVIGFTITGMNNPRICVVTPNGNNVFVGNSTASTVKVIGNASSGTPAVIATLNTGTVPVQITISPDGNYAYVSNTNTTTMTVIGNASSANPAVIGTITGLNAPLVSAVTPNGEFIYVPNTGTTTVSVIDNLGLGLKINGSLATSSPPVVSFGNVSRTVSLTSTNNLSGTNITITGTDQGAIQTETRAGPNNNTVFTTKLFDTVTSVTANLIVTGLSVGSGTTGQTQWFQYDSYAQNSILSAQVVVAGTITYSFVSTIDDVTTTTAPFVSTGIVIPQPNNANAYTLVMNSQSTSQFASLTYPVRYADMLISAATTGSLVFTLLQQGIR